jgi:predicted nucleic acid-binding Zn ribbon protein
MAKKTIKQIGENKMSEYPISCDNCGSYLGLVHASEWSSNTLCEKCSHDLRVKRELNNLEKNNDI